MPRGAASPSLAARWLRATPSLRDSALRLGYLRSEIERRDLAEVARALDELAGRAEQADPIAREVLAAVVPLLGEPLLAGRIEALRREAAGAALLPLGRLLRCGAREPGEPAIDARFVPTTSEGRALTLGERRALARQPSRASLAKLVRDPHPMVIHLLLRNPRITEDDVLRLAARRPASAEVIAEIARHPEWSARARVRMALVQNPGTPRELAVPLLGLLLRPELAQVAGAADVPAVVRAAALELLERRPPVPPRGGKGPLQ